MSNKAPILRRLSVGLACFSLVAGLVPSGHARVLDDFNDNTKTAWTDFVFGAGAGSIVEQNGQLKLELPGEATIALNSALFCASTKTSETFELQEGRTIEFRVDVVQGGGDRSYATLAFIPTASGGPGELKGYTLAKSPTDVLLVKGINQYFIDDDTETAPPKQDNITLVLSLTVKGGSVIIHGEVLDKDQNDTVIWEYTTVDTPATDPMDTGTDSPPAPYLGAGNFVLLLYADYDPSNQSTAEFPFQATYDNAEVFVTESVVIDDFNDNQKTQWDDFSFMPPFGTPVEQNGQFYFEMPLAFVSQVGAVFSASTKTSPLVEVKEGERLEFRVDIVNGGLKDSFAVMGFIPTSVGGPGTLKGYSFAKSITDILIVKGIQQYFVADDEATADLKQENVTLVLTLTTRNGVVTIDAKILDKDANDAVIWHRRVQDTSAADLMEDGTDSPATPYIGTGNFVLMLYADFTSTAPEDPYYVTYDNAVVAAPPQAGNQPPVIGDIQPTDRANFLSAPAQISFKVTDDQALADEKISVTVNGTNYTTSNGLVLSGTGNTRTATLGGLPANQNYVVTLRAEDSGGDTTTKDLYFDTFAVNTLVLEAEDYNFSSGQFIDNVVIVPEQGWDANSYSYQPGVENVDYSDTRTSPAGFNNNPYRSDDEVRAARTRDNVRAKYTAAGGANAGVYDYDVGDIAANEWMNYTHTFPAGSYEVYLRESIANLQTAESVLEKVTSDRTQENQTTESLGSFLGTLSGFTYRNVALTDASGQNKVVLRLSGVTTLRLRQITSDTGDSARLLNYLAFIPVADAGVQRATVSAVTPASGSTVETVDPLVSATIQNRDTSVKTQTVQLEVNGQVVAATVTSTATGATVSYTMAALPVSGANNVARVTFKDSDDVDVSTSWEFIVTYRSVDPALRIAGSGKDRGLMVRVVQAQVGENTDNSLTFAENLLRPGTTMLKQYELTDVVTQIINYSQDGPGTANGNFPDDLLIPQLDVLGFGTDDIAMEITTYLDLPAGKYRFGTTSDDGYKVQVVSDFNARDTAPLAFHNGGVADESYDFVVSAGGLYRIRMVWYERGGGAHVEWWQGNFANADRVALNSNGTGLVKAYTSFTQPTEFAPPVLSGGQLTISWTGAGVLQESANLSSWTDVPAQPASPYVVSVGTAAGAKFYRIRP